MASSQPGKHGDKGKPKKGQIGSQGTSSPEQGSAKGQCNVGGRMWQGEEEQRWLPLERQQ